MVFTFHFIPKTKKQNASKSKKRNCNAKHLRIVRLGRLDKQKQYNNYFDCRANGLVLFFIFSYNKKMFQARVNKNYCWLETRITVMGVLISALVDYRSPSPIENCRSFCCGRTNFQSIWRACSFIHADTTISYSNFIQIALFGSHSKRMRFEVSM